MATKPFDYTKIIAVADKLIKRFGRQVTIYLVASAPANPLKPWRGEDTAATGKLEGIWAAIVTWEDDDDKGAVRAARKVALIPATQIPLNNGEYYNTLIDDDASVWHLRDCDVIKPGASRVLYIYTCER
jgi:hypothetical protein